MFKDENPTPLDIEIERLQLKLAELEPTSEQYRTTLDTLVSLYKVRADSAPKPISRDTILLAATNILGIVLILRAEHLNVITSQAMGRIQRL